MERSLTPFNRGSGLLNPLRVQEEHAIVVGVGGVGSFTALALAKLGVPKIKLIDHDEIEEGNTGVQLYGGEAVGALKVTAWTAAAHLLLPGGCAIAPIPEKFDKAHLTDEITAIFSCVDSMTVRKEIFDVALAKIKKGRRLFLFDARIGSDLIRMHVADLNNKDDVKHYAESLYSSEEAEPLPCAERNIAYMSFLSAGFLSSAYASAIRGEEYPRETWYKAHAFDLIRVK